MYVCVCMCVCVHVRVCAYVHACVCVWLILLTQPNQMSTLHHNDQHIIRYRREADVMKEENKRMRQEQVAAVKECTQLKKELENMENRLEKLSKVEEEYTSLQEVNRKLKQEADMLHEQFESLLVDKEELEFQNKDAMQALNEEREAKTVLETKLKEEFLRSPAHPSWEMEKEAATVGNLSNHTDSREHVLSQSTPAPGKTPRVLSTPYSPKRTPNLLSELQSSFMASVDLSELESLRQRCKEAENALAVLQKQKLALEERVASFTLLQTEAGTEAENIKEEHVKALGERDRMLETLKEEMLLKEDTLGQLRNKVSTTTAERLSMEIEVEGLKDELQRAKQSSAQEIEKLEDECTQERAKNMELKGHITVLEDKFTLLSNTTEKLESIIYSSHSEISSMADDLKALHRTVATLSTDGKLAIAGTKSPERNSFAEEQNSPAANQAQDSAPLSPFYSLELKQGKMSVPVHRESHSLQVIAKLHEQLRSVRSPLEKFTKSMLERSLAQSAKHIPIDAASVPEKSATSNRKNSLDFEATINKWKAKLSHKTEEITNLRAIMKARQTTAEVAISSLRSKLEGQARAYQTELTRLKHQLKVLKKERDEHKSLRGMYAKRCEDYVDDILRIKRENESLKLETDELMVSLKKTIQRKLDLSRELEEYKVELERNHNIPKQLGSSRI